MTCKYQEKNLREFYICLPGNEYTQLKLYAWGPIQNVGVPICIKRHFQDEIYKISLQINITRLHVHLQ